MDKIGKYKVLGELGRGGFGAVYLCEDNLRQKVAVKFFDPKDDVISGVATSATNDASEVLRDRFQSEAITLRKLSSNPYIVDLYDFDETEDGVAYYVMPYLEHSLVDEIGKDTFSVGALEDLEPALRPRRLPIPQAIRVLTEILEGMKIVHREGLVHRDLKPANILFDKAGTEGKVQICDFGIAKLPDTEHSQSGFGMGSRNYMSPEQRESAKHVDASSDVYAIGVMTYRMLTGALPLGRYDDPIVYAPGIGQQLNDLVIKSIDADPNERPKDAGAFLSALKNSLASLDTTAVEYEATGTWISQGDSLLRDELKPLRDRIEMLLLECGEVEAEPRETLETLAAIANLDGAGLDALIESVAATNAARIVPVTNFLSRLDERVASGMTAAKREALYVGGDSIGWDRAKIDRLIADRSADIGTTAVAQARPPGSPSIPPSVIQIGKVGAILVLLFGGGYWLYEVQQQRVEREQTTAAKLSTKKQAELNAWDEATATNTVAGFRAYFALPIANAQHKEEALKRIREYEQQVEQVKLAEGARQLEQVDKVETERLKVEESQLAELQQQKERQAKIDIAENSIREANENFIESKASYDRELLESPLSQKKYQPFVSGKITRERLAATLQDINTCLDVKQGSEFFYSCLSTRQYLPAQTAEYNRDSKLIIEFEKLQEENSLRKVVVHEKQAAVKSECEKHSGLVTSLEAKKICSEVEKSFTYK